MTFAWPIALLGLVVVALALIAYLVAQRRRRRDGSERVHMYPWARSCSKACSLSQSESIC